MRPELLTELQKELNWTLPDSVTLIQGGEGISISCDGKATALTYKTNTDLARGLVLLKQYGIEHAYTHEEACSFEMLGIMLDCSRNAVMTVESLKQFMRLLALMGYNMLQLYTEDTYEIEGEPYFGYLRGRYTKEEMKALDAYAKELGIEMIPCIQVLAHLNTLFKCSKYASRYRDCADILLCGNEKVEALIDRMFATMAECYTSRRINIGMDEAHMVGLGKYLDKNGYRDRFDILSAHLKRVCEIAEKYGFRPMIWSDMYFRLATNGSYYLEGKECKIPERVFSNLPEKISLVYWDYYHTEKERYDEMIVAHKKFDREILFCNHARSAICFTPQNATAQSMIEPSVRSCVQHEIKHFFLTMWGDDGGECSRYATLPTLAYTASLAYGNFDMKAIKKLFHTLTGIKFDDFMTVDSMNQLPAPPENGAGLSKALLYNDPLVGIFDITAKERPEIKENAAKALPALSCLSKNKSFGYIFRTQKALAKLLILKADFGVRLRAAYQTGDKETLAALADECKKISALLDKFYTEFHAQWMKENKPFGFDVQDLRLGGLLQRLRACRTLIIEYLSGKRTSIEELEADILPEQVNLNWSWEYICSANSLYKFLAE